MHMLINWVRHLRRIHSFAFSIRMVVVVLMLLGVWVATRKLEMPPGLSLNDKLIHMVVFFGFAVLVDLSTSRRPFWLWKGAPLLIYGAMIEILQYFSPDRSFSVLDWLADFSGILLYFILKYFILWIDSKRTSNLKY